MAENPTNPQDEVISLDGLDKDVSPDPSAPKEAPAEQQPPEPPSDQQDLTPEKILEFIKEADDQFITKLDELSASKGFTVPDDYNFHNDAYGFFHILKKVFAKTKRLLIDPLGVLRRYYGTYSETLAVKLNDKKTLVIDYLLYLKNGGLKAGLKYVGEKFHAGKQQTQDKLKAAWVTPRWKKVYAILFLTLMALLVKVVSLFMSNNPLPSLEKKMVTSFTQVADEVYTYDQHSEMEQFDSPLRHSDYTVLLGKVIANLKCSNNSTIRPFGAFRFHFEASTREAAMELIDREKEFLDLMQRTLEEMTWDDLSTPEGKNRMKLVLRKRMNEVLNRGRVKKIFIETFILKN